MLNNKRVYQTADFGSISKTHQSLYYMISLLQYYRLVDCVIDNGLIEAWQQTSVSDSQVRSSIRYLLDISFSVGC